MRALFDTAAERLCETRPAPTNRFLPPTKLRAAGGGSGLPASVRVEDRESRAQSGGGKGGNHRGTATLDDHERAPGVSGKAIRGEKKVAKAPGRESACRHGQK